MDKWPDLNLENLKQQAEPVDSQHIMDQVQGKRCSRFGYGMCRGDPLTITGKRIQLMNILCLTVIPILVVWGFTMHSLSISAGAKSDIETAKMSMAVVVKLGQLIHRLQRERDMSVLYLSEIGPGTKHFLLAEYMATDDALHSLTVWPKELQSNPKKEFRSKVNLMSFISQHRASLNPNKVDLFEEINFYSSITSEFLEWLIENIKGSGFGSIWKTLVAYQKITRCKEDIGVERAYGVMFYITGSFEKWVDYEFYNEKINDFKYNYKTAVLYSDNVVPLHTDEVNEIKSTGLNITEIIYDYRHEIQNHQLNMSYQSVEKAKWFFDNITIYLDALLAIQEQVAGRISQEVDEVLAEVEIKVAVYALMVVMVIVMCPVIILAANGLTSDIQIYSLKLFDKNTELSLEKCKTEKLLHHYIPACIKGKLRSNGQVESEYFKSVTILFSEIYGFNRLSMCVSPHDLVGFLNSMYVSMDAKIGQYDAYKVEAIHDEYLVASGVPVRNGGRHAPEIATLSLELMNLIRKDVVRLPDNQSLHLRIGICTGSCMAGVVGHSMLRYCLFGNTISTAAKLMAHSTVNNVNVAETTQRILQKHGGFRLIYKGNMDVKGKRMKTFYMVDMCTGDTDNDSSCSMDGGKRATEEVMPGEVSNYSEAPRAGNKINRNDSSTTTSIVTTTWNEEDVFFL